MLYASTWIKGNRWYRLEMGRDLLGDSVFIRSWGSRVRAGAKSITATLAPEDAPLAMQRAEVLRERRGYVRIDEEWSVSGDSISP